MFDPYQEYITGGIIAIALKSPHGTVRAVAELAAIKGRYAYEMAKWGHRHFPAKAAREIVIRSAKSKSRSAARLAVGVARGAKHPVLAVAIAGSVAGSALIQNQIRQASPDKQTLLVAAYTGQHAGLPPQPLGVMM